MSDSHSRRPQPVLRRFRRWKNRPRTLHQLVAGLLPTGTLVSLDDDLFVRPEGLIRADLYPHSVAQLRRAIRNGVMPYTEMNDGSMFLNVHVVWEWACSRNPGLDPGTALATGVDLSEAVIIHLLSHMMGHRISCRSEEGTHVEGTLFSYERRGDRISLLFHHGEFWIPFSRRPGLIDRSENGWFLYWLKSTIEVFTKY